MNKLMFQFRRAGFVEVPADKGVPSDLPAWARDEIVASRLHICDLLQQIGVMQFHKEKSWPLDP